MESAGKSATIGENEFLTELYDMTTRDGGEAIQFRIFDVQLCGNLDEEWLKEAITNAGIPSEEADWMIMEGILRSRRNSRGEAGYILYTPYQAEVLKKLMQTGRYDVEELRHIMSEWDDYLEAIVMEEPAYDDESISDYQHIVRRAHEMLDLLEEKDDRECPSFIATEEWGAQQADSAAKAEIWRRVCSIVDCKTEEQLSPQLRDSLQRELFRLRWWDEFVRLTMAKKFDTAIVKGYSPDVTFDGFTSQGNEVTLGHVNWYSTLRRYRETRLEGKTFPLRAPDFNLTERGLEFLVTPTPTRYAELYEAYRLGVLAKAIEEIGPELWTLKGLSIGDATCPECDARFERPSPRRIYCTEECRKRAKSRRWRERDPERARQCQARYWKGY